MEAMQTSSAVQNKKTGRKPKYNSDDERKQAKREQTRRCLQKIYDKKREETMNKREEKIKIDILNQIEKLKFKNRVDIIEQALRQIQVC